MRGVKKYIKPLPIRYIILVFFLIIIICILFFKSKQGFVVTSGGIVTIAGTGVITTPTQNRDSIPSIIGVAPNGDGGLAVNATLYSPQGVAVDLDGNIYIADSQNHRIRKVDLTGKITTIAGRGVFTTSAQNTASIPGTSGIAQNGDGGPAINATFNNPRGVAIDSDGNIYIADGHYRIRKLTKNTGIIITIAGTGIMTTTGQNSPTNTPNANGVYPNGDGGPAIKGNFSIPSGIAVDSDGNIYIADSSHRIRKLTKNTGTDPLTYNISTIAGTGLATTTAQNGDGGPAISATVNNPQGIAVDTSGNIYIADNSNQRIRKLTLNADKTTYNISTVAGTGTAGVSGDDIPALSATLNSPSGVAVDSSRNIYIIDNVNCRIRKVDTTGIITTLAGNGLQSPSIIQGENILPINAFIRGNFGITLDSAGNIYFAEGTYNRIRKIYK